MSKDVWSEVRAKLAGDTVSAPALSLLGVASSSELPAVTQRARGVQVSSPVHGSLVLQSWMHCSRSQCCPEGQSALMMHAGFPVTGGGGPAFAPLPPSEDEEHATMEGRRDARKRA
jgi:hypothetical protein